MNEETVTDAVVRRFLLGDVDDSERQRIERLFMSDPEFRKKIQLAEEDLIEDYLEECLTPLDRNKFLEHYGYSPQQRRKLRIAKSIKDHAVAESERTAISALPRWQIIFSMLRTPRIFIPVGATLTIALVVSVIWLVQLNGRRTQESNRRLAIEQELAEINEPSSLRENPSQVLLLVLPPVAIRSIKPQMEVAPRADTRFVELHLLWTQKERYPSYKAVIRRVGSAEQFAIPGLHIESSSSGNAVRLRLPAHILTRGLYQVSLSGIASDGAPQQPEEYTFMVGG